jgi:hypothetical protein
MESCGMVLAFPVTAAASAVYAALAVFGFTRFPLARWVLLIPSIAVLLLAFCEALLLMTHGVVGARTWLGPRFETLHGIVFFLTPPAVANTLVFVPRSPLRDWKIVALATFFVAIGFVFWNYGLQETLYGPDGIGGPFSNEGR